MNKYKLLYKDFKILKDSKSEEIIHITNNTKDIKPNSIFFAIKGSKFDGHQFIKKAVSKGAKVIFISDKSKIKDLKNINATIVLVDNTRKAQALVAKKFYGNPSKDLKVIGITGTNGKTTVSNLIYQYLSMYGKEIGIIGTIWYRFKDKIYDAGRTTPDSIKWNELLRKMKNQGAQFISAEISSHAIDQYRVYGTKFEGGIFTNLTQDHLDYHKDMESYFQTKKSFFDYILQEKEDALISTNVDNYYGKRIYEEFKNKNIISYGKESSQFKIKNFETSMEGLYFEVNYKGKILKLKSRLRGDFNIYNISAAFSFLAEYGIDIEFLKEATRKLIPIKGRFEIIPAKDFLVVNDYAHTPDALENILKSLLKIKKRRIIIVFGAGGDRDKTKRPKMGSIAEKYADIIILTSDNPRSEDPVDIIEDIKTGMEMKKDIIEIVDREEAIKEAIKIAMPEDIVLISGKGHETYQIIGENIYHFDDSDVAKKYLKMFNKSR
ncbi:UDP-N-acetylmuramoyl-L-alanyl-D-glutamate--2,6-diaminopimelate ligase [Hydrogenothermus marinus]|uniref:UDP-N-acetylmuramoyl-L-alanyl-D-glutamate--2,6-diaminopimelate ligase n=1 Tax=Hydrogenothermus marinus TaxID=133270 RepID=A0A3M0BI00_9AQUI|nr:UDP-N-acetylmuramoyl-L-alanyl-D-glutamate--2,6-diaminopimelate ligase [Hydrogenothermus marinus]RMA96990.1 UDP-N-acetylmuramoylalanyl-D-glutamate--2,6-diaminopimelate ligase [Hydrogenothermus marinus]